MNRIRKVAVLGLALLLAIGLSGCVSSLPGSGDGADGTDGADGADGEAVELKEEMRGAMEDVETYQVEMDMDIEIEDGYQSVDMRMQGTFDRADEKAEMTVELRGQRVTTYIDGQTMYAETGYGGWQNQEMDEDPWKEGNATTWESQEAILDDGDIEVAGTETVDGESTTVLEVDITAEEFKKAMSTRQTGSASASIESVDDIEYKIYVSEDTDRVRKIEMTMTADVDTRQGVKTVDYDITMTFSDYNDDVTIEIPEDAKERLTPATASVTAATAASTPV